MNDSWKAIYDSTDWEYGNFDNDYEDHNLLLYIIFPLCFIGIGIPLYFIYLRLGLEKSDAIIPHSIGNYAHAQYQNIMNSFKEKEILMECNRWNYSPCINKEAV